MSEERKNAKELGPEELDRVAGGGYGNDEQHDLSRFVTKTVCNVVHYDDTTCLHMYRTPGGDSIPGVGWQNGEPILVHDSYREENWLFAFKSGQFGYVSANNVM